MERLKKLERFHNSLALCDSAKGAFFLRKKALEGIGSGYSNCGTAIAVEPIVHLSRAGS
jgi:hypothetical protein